MHSFRYGRQERGVFAPERGEVGRAGRRVVLIVDALVDAGRPDVARKKQTKRKHQRRAPTRDGGHFGSAARGGGGLRKPRT